MWSMKKKPISYCIGAERNARTVSLAHLIAALFHQCKKFAIGKISGIRILKELPQ